MRFVRTKKRKTGKNHIPIEALDKELIVDIEPNGQAEVISLDFIMIDHNKARILGFPEQKEFGINIKLNPSETMDLLIHVLDWHKQNNTSFYRRFTNKSNTDMDRSSNVGTKDI